MEWLPMILPFLTVLICFTWFREYTLWWEALIPIGASIITILIFKYAAETYSTRDIEYWNGTIQYTAYYEEWNEYIHRTCSYTDSDGNTHTYDCSYVDWHPEFWVITDNNELTEEISQIEYNRLMKLFGNSTFVDMHRDYHSVDGDMYISYWPKTEDTREIMVTKHSYENRIQASNSVFNFAEVTPEEIQMYDLKEYPKIDRNHKQRHLLGDDNKKVERQLELLNARLGKDKELTLFIIDFGMNSKHSAEFQEAYWKGGNKNEVIVCIGSSDLSADDAFAHKPKYINWSYVITWSENQLLKINIRNYLAHNPTLDYNTLIPFLEEELSKNFERKHFADFSYLKVDLTPTQIILNWIINIILSIGMGLIVIKNGAKEQ